MDAVSLLHPHRLDDPDRTVCDRPINFRRVPELEFLLGGGGDQVRRAAFGATETRADTITLPDALLALTRLCLLHYAVDEKTTVTKLPQPDARQREILAALGITLPAM